MGWRAKPQRWSIERVTTRQLLAGLREKSICVVLQPELNIKFQTECARNGVTPQEIFHRAAREYTDFWSEAK